MAKVMMGGGESAPVRNVNHARMLDVLPSGVVHVSGSGDVAYSNRAARKLFGSDEQLHDAFSGAPQHRPPVLHVDDRRITVEWMRHGDGALALLRDGTDDANAVARAEAEARLDSLTELPNRKAFAEEANAALTEAAELSTEVAMLMVDLDGFKPVNDTLGHAVGDALLRAVAGRLRGATRDGETVYRLGGDEFAILLPEPDGGAGGPIAAADALARRVVDLAGRSFLIEGQMVRIGASVGVAVSEGTVDADAILRRADIALYRAKEGGRSRHAHYEAGMDRALQERRELELDLRRALALEQFELHYQPQFDLHGATVTGFEALVRWQHPSRGMVSPADFIPVAEASGQIVPIGEWVLRAACAEAASWTAPLEVSVNASPVQFASGDFVDTVRRALDRSGLDARRLVIEITEGVLLAETGDTMATLTALRDLGVRIAMDDFGTGCSSLSYLRSFPFDIVKVDQSFVRGEGDPDRLGAIVRAVTSLGHSIGMTITAEGVETMEQLEAVRADGCGSVQGFLIGKPMTRDDLAAFFEDAADAFAPAPAPQLPEPVRVRVTAPPLDAAEPGAGGASDDAAPARDAAAPHPSPDVRAEEPDADAGAVASASADAGAAGKAGAVDAGKAAEPVRSKPGEGVYRLVYQSVCAIHESEAALTEEVEAILSVAQRKNAENGVSGALMFNGTHYAQVLEGTRRAVEATFERIQLDPRHSEVMLLSFEPVAERLFGTWSMAHVTARGGRLGELAALTGFDREALAGDAMAERLHDILVDEARERAEPA